MYLSCMAGIYKIANIKTGRCYIGATRNALGRFQVHLSELKRGVHHCERLQKSFNKFGIENFSFIIIEECEDTDIVKVEQKWIDYYVGLKQCYNTILTACDKGFDSLETRQRKSLAMMGNQNSLGRVVSEEEKQKARERNLGKTYGEETKAKQREAKLGKESLKKIPIMQYDLNQRFIKEHKSTNDAAKELNLIRTNIIKVLKRYRNHCGGFIFRYKDITKYKDPSQYMKE